MSKTYLLLLVFTTLLITTGCKDETESTKDNMQETITSDKEAKSDDETQPINPGKLREKKPLESTERYVGTIKHLDLEGGFYGIITKDGKKILPLNLDKQFAQDGAVIEFSGEAADMMTIQQWGTPFKIKNVKLIKSGRPISYKDM